MFRLEFSIFGRRLCVEFNRKSDSNLMNVSSQEIEADVAKTKQDLAEAYARALANFSDDDTRANLLDIKKIGDDFIERGGEARKQELAHA